MKHILPVLWVTIIIGCRHHSTKEKSPPQKKIATEVPVVNVKLLPLGKTSSRFVDGVDGVDLQPGNAGVASDFRLRNKNNFFKVVIHELGHTAGLPHCPEKICFMRDAEGGDPTGEEKEFCEKCKGYLKSKGWKL